MSERGPLPIQLTPSGIIKLFSEKEGTSLQKSRAIRLNSSRKKAERLLSYAGSSEDYSDMSMFLFDACDTLTDIEPHVRASRVLKQVNGSELQLIIHKRKFSIEGSTAEMPLWGSHPLIAFYEVDADNNYSSRILSLARPNLSVMYHLDSNSFDFEGKILLGGRYLTPTRIVDTILQDESSLAYFHKKTKLEDLQQVQSLLTQGFSIPS